MADKAGVYGLGPGSRAWQVCIGCSPKMSCAKNCWARRTIARTVECMRVYHPSRAGFYQRALTPDLQQWSDNVLIDEAHMNDPLKWRKPALIATGFHGDWGRLSASDKTRLLGVVSDAYSHKFILLSKQPASIREDIRGPKWPWKPPYNTSLGCSVMNQAEANRQRESMAALAKLGWHTHCWYEPAIGPVNWSGWEFLELLIVGGESGAGARAMNPAWARNARDWAAANGAKFRFKQHGDWAPTEDIGFGGREHLPSHVFSDGAGYGTEMVRVGKRAAGNLLDGQEHNGLPDWMRV